MIKTVIADTSAIVGFLSETDQWYKSAYPYFERFSRPVLTCEAVITECCFLMQNSLNGEKQVLQLIATDTMRIDFSIAVEVERLGALMEKYKSVPMSLADACLVRMSEIFNAPIFTFDSDFRIYRRNGREQIPILGLED